MLYLYSGYYKSSILSPETRRLLTYLQELATNYPEENSSCTSTFLVRRGTPCSSTELGSPFCWGLELLQVVLCTHNVCDAALYLQVIATSGQGPDASHRTRLGEASGLPLSLVLLALQLSSARLSLFFYL